jgi:hypothetical protein
MDVVGSGKNEFFSFEWLKVVNEVVDHIIAVHNGLATAKNELFPGEKREVLLEP